MSDSSSPPARLPACLPASTASLRPEKQVKCLPSSPFMNQKAKGRDHKEEAGAGAAVGCARASTNCHVTHVYLLTTCFFSPSVPQGDALRVGATASLYSRADRAREHFVAPQLLLA